MTINGVGNAATLVASTAAKPSDEERLRKSATQLESLFSEQMFKAMRATVPEGGVVDGGSGEEMFTGMLDQHIAAETPAQWQHGLGDALFRQLRRSLPSSAPSATAGTSVDATSQQHPMQQQMQSLHQIQQLQQLPQAAGSTMPAMAPASPERVGASGR